MRRGVGTLMALAVVASPAVVASFGSPYSAELQARPSDGYRVVYRVEDRTRREPRITTESLEVGRPYGGRLEMRSGDEITSGQVTNRDYFWQLGDGGEPQFGVRRIPAGPARDASYAALRDAADVGAVDVVGAGRVQGRRCIWFAFREPGLQPLRPPTDRSRIESCVDASGVVLMEVWQIGGRAARILEAVSVSAGAPPGPRFLTGKDPSSGPVRRPDALRLIQGQFVVDDDADVELPTEVRAPQGWAPDRRAVVSAASGSGRATQFLSETFVRDMELVIVERGTHPALRPTWPVNEGRRIELGALGAGRVVHYADRVEMRLIGNVGFIRVAAPSRRVAIAFVRGLRDRS